MPDSPADRDDAAAGVESSLGAALLKLLARAREESAPAVDDAHAAARPLAEEGARLVSGGAAAICVASPVKRTFIVLATSGGAAAALEGRTWPRRGSVMQRALERQNPIEVEDADELNVMGPALREAGFRSVRAIPLITGDTTSPDPNVGVYLALRREHGGFEPAERSLLDAYAPLVALTLRRVEEQAAEAAQGRRMRLGVDVAMDLTSALTPGEVNHRILVRTADAVDADRATLLRLERDDLVVEDTFDRDGRPGSPGLRLPLREHPVMVRTLAGRDIERVDVGEHAEMAEVRGALDGVQHSLVVPLVFSNEVSGFLNLHRRRDTPFAHGDISTVQMISSLAVLALRNARLYTDAQAAKEAMSEFLDVVVHDLRAPLTVVGGYCNMMGDGIFGAPLAAWSRPLEVVQNKVREAQHLVEQLLLAARLDSGDLPAHDQDVDLCRVAVEAVSRAEPQAQLNGAHVTSSLPQKPVWARADPANLEQIIDNLVNNAITYGGNPAEIEVAVHDNDRPGVSVRDHGPGIPADKRERIFDRFFRGHEGVQGSGLGLYVSRRLAAASHGTLELDPQWTGGSRFVLRLARVPAASAGGGQTARSVGVEQPEQRSFRGAHT